MSRSRCSLVFVMSSWSGWYWRSYISSFTFIKILFSHKHPPKYRMWVLSTEGSLTFFVGGCKQKGQTLFKVYVDSEIDNNDNNLLGSIWETLCKNAVFPQSSINRNVDSAIWSKWKDKTKCCYGYKHSAGLVKKTFWSLKDTQQLFTEVI